jgi:hypothetical protein
MQLLRFALDRILQRFHQRGVFGDVVVLVANPFGDAHWAAGAALNHHSNARRARISQAPAVHVSHQVRSHVLRHQKSRHQFGSVVPLLNHALICRNRQYRYLIPFQRFALCPGGVQVYV